MFSSFSPLNLLDGYENRFAYSLAFGITTSYCIFMVFNNLQYILGQWVTIKIKDLPPYVSGKCELISLIASRCSTMLQIYAFVGIFL